MVRISVGGWSVSCRSCAGRSSAGICLSRSAVRTQMYRGPQWYADFNGTRISMVRGPPSARGLLTFTIMLEPFERIWNCSGCFKPRPLFRACLRSPVTLKAKNVPKSVRNPVVMSWNPSLRVSRSNRIIVLRRVRGRGGARYWDQWFFWAYSTTIAFIRSLLRPFDKTF